jgi:hypothetical protein
VRGPQAASAKSRVGSRRRLSMGYLWEDDKVSG